jgi:hypothetical protein
MTNRFLTIEVDEVTDIIRETIARKGHCVVTIDGAKWDVLDDDPYCGEEPPLDTPCLDTSFHDHEMDV